MSYDRANPDHCPTCDRVDSEADPCPHRATRRVHIAWREGRDAYAIPMANGEAFTAACPYPADSDDACWWHRAVASEARLARAIEAEQRLRTR